MRKFFRIFLLYSQHALVYKGRSFVWFLVTVIDSAAFLLFWIGALPTNSSVWNLSGVVSYYLILIIAGCLLQVHIEEEVAFEDIQLGWLSRNLTKPISYFWLMFCRELPWRLIQGSFGIIILFIVLAFYKFPLVSLSNLPLVILIILFAYLLSFTYKMIVGLTAFWVTDFTGIHNLEGVASMLLAGFIVPLNLLPVGLKTFALIQPLAYMIYYPVVAIQGTLTVPQLFQTLGMQILWLLISLWIYKRMWTAGLRQFTAVGQ